MAKCLCGCGKDVKSKGKKPALYASDACRMRYKRTLTKNKRTQETNKSITNEQDKTNTIKKRTEQTDTVLTKADSPNKATGQLESNELNRQTLPSDADYDGVCKT